VFVVRTLLKLGDYSNVIVLVLDSAVTEISTHRHNPKERRLHSPPLPGIKFDSPIIHSVAYSVYRYATRKHNWLQYRLGSLLDCPVRSFLD
jgi:hypothetical protein